MHENYYGAVGIDMIVNFLSMNKWITTGRIIKTPSLLEATCSCIGLSNHLVESLLRLEASCTHYLALETKIFAALVQFAALV